ncbi:hypothetical protein HanPI659440_Chr01g0027541 [Helianthus annuus]|nr:hypothetical protein HanPI659440_Chr01g0027541 [Helianthus annuus]
MWLRGRDRVLSWVSWLRSEGRVPVRDLSGRFMEVTRLELSHWMPSQLQKEEVVVQVGGVEERVVESFDMTAASSPVVWVVRKRRRVVVIKRWGWR